MTTIQHGALPPLDSTTFDELIGSAALPVVVDVWAPWCGPCAPMAESLATVAAEQADALITASLDSEEHPDIARRFGIQSVPTLLVFRDGELVDRLVGARGPARLREDLAAHLAAHAAAHPG